VFPSTASSYLPKIIKQKTKVLPVDSAQNYPYSNCLNMLVAIL